MNTVQYTTVLLTKRFFCCIFIAISQIKQVWWHAATLFIYFTLIEHTYNLYIYNSSSAVSCFPHSFRSVEGLLWGAEPRFELGPALQQADVLLSEPCRTLTEPCRTLKQLEYMWDYSLLSNILGCVIWSTVQFIAPISVFFFDFKTN